MRLLIISDIHANLSALNRILEDADSRYEYDEIAILGDIINYGMRPAETIDILRSLRKPVTVNLFGNHEKALFDGDTSHFSTDRGRAVLEYTRNILTDDSREYLINNLSRTGMSETIIDGKRFLFVHGTLSDPFWGKMNDEEKRKPEYARYDYVISGHSHIPDFTEFFYEDSSMPEYRNRKRTVFLNPGSAGQPRNHNPEAQYLFVDTEREIFHFNSVKYDVEYEQSLYMGENIDNFYKTRLTNGI